MLSKNEAKYIQSLYHKKTRDAESLFIAEGVKIIDELLHSNFEIIQLYATEEWTTLNDPQPKITIVSLHELKKISNLQNPNHVLAVIKKPHERSHPVLHDILSLMLDGIQDPGNLGSIIRTADWFGITNIIASKDTADLYNPKVIQATMGSFMRINIFYKDLKEVLAINSIPVYGALLDGMDVRENGLIKEGILIVGNEGRGIRPELIPFITQKITIRKGQNLKTINEGAESLNAAIATGIILSHITM